RSRTSGEYFFALVMTPISQRLEPPANPGRFSGSGYSAAEQLYSLYIDWGLAAIRTRREKDDATTALERIDRCLDGLRIIGTAVASGTELSDIDPRLDRGCVRRPQERGHIGAARYGKGGTQWGAREVLHELTATRHDRTPTVSQVLNSRRKVRDSGNPRGRGNIAPEPRASNPTLRAQPDVSHEPYESSPDPPPERVS